MSLLFAVGIIVPSCNSDDDNSEDYEAWREVNDAWLEEMKAKVDENGNPYYTSVVSKAMPGGYILMHFFNDRSETASNLVPISTSIVDVIYRGYTCEDEAFDSSMLVSSYGRTGVQRFQCNSTINGWLVAMQNMHVGDTAEIIVPYDMGYGTSLYGTILPYTNMRFNLRLYDIYKYEANPY